MADQGQRTEKPTKRKIEKTRREGQFPASRELLAAMQFLTFVILLVTGGGAFFERTRDMVRYFLALAFHLSLTPRAIVRVYRDFLGHIFTPLLWMGFCLTTVSVVVQLGSTRLGLSLQNLAPDLKRLNPL